MQIIYILLFLFQLMTAASAQSAVINYTDRLNRTVEIPVPVERVVFLQMYEMLPALDAWDKVAGIASYALRNEVIRAAKPDIDSIPSVGNGWNINVEAILKLKPDLIITWAARPESLHFMEEKGLRVIAIYPESIAELYEVMQLLGTLLNREEKMAATKAKMEAVFYLVRDRTARRVKEKQQKMVYLNGQPNSVSGALGINNDLLKLIGGINPAGGIADRAPSVSLEQMLIWNPEVIFIWEMPDIRPGILLKNSQWRSIRAIQENRVYKLPDWTTWGPRLPLVALYMAQKAYPEDFADIDFSKVADSLYKEVFHTPYQPKEWP